VLALSECFDDESEGEEAEEEDIELFEAGEDAAVALHAAGRDVRSHCVSCKGRGRSARDRRGWTWAGRPEPCPARVPVVWSRLPS